MSTLQLSEAAYRRDLGDGLVLRWSTPADVEGVAQLYSHVFRDNAEAPLNQAVAAWTRDLMSGRHPLLGPGDFALVEDTRQGAIVASTCLMSQTWEYDGIPIPIGRPEIVASAPDYRNRGLVRAIFELIHARSSARGQMLQAITGIPYYYRLFGYEYALDLGGGRSIYFTSIPKLKAGQTEPYRLRDATPQDLPLVLKLYDGARHGDHLEAPLLVSTRIDEQYWRFTIDGHSPASGEGWRTQMILDNADRPVGYVTTRHKRWNDALGVVDVVVEPCLALVTLLPSLLRALQTFAATVPGTKPDTPPASRIAFMMGQSHPVYDALGDTLSGRGHPPYTWYVRVPDLPGFIRHIAPALERRLARSVATGYSGEIKLDFYRDGLRMVFENGRLAAAEPWRGRPWGPEAQGGFPPLVFLQLLFGYRSLADLRYAYPDAWASDEAQPIIEALFPAQLSRALPLD